MAQLSGKSQRTIVSSIEVVSDDTQDVLKFRRDDDGTVTISTRKSHESDWSAKAAYQLAVGDAQALAAVIEGTNLEHLYGGGKPVLAAASTNSFKVEPTIIEKKIEEGDCTPLDIERAKAANLAEQKQIVQLELERDHSLDRHVSAIVPGCPACDRRFTSADATTDIPF